jgi:hypothetical protein
LMAKNMPVPSTSALNVKKTIGNHSIFCLFPGCYLTLFVTWQNALYRCFCTFRARTDCPGDITPTIFITPLAGWLVSILLKSHAHALTKRLS